MLFSNVLYVLVLFNNSVHLCFAIFVTFDSLNISSSSKKRCHSVHLICMCSTCTLQMGYILKVVIVVVQILMSVIRIDFMIWWILMLTLVLYYIPVVFWFLNTLPISVCVFNIIFFFKKFFGGKEGCVCVCVMYSKFNIILHKFELHAVNLFLYFFLRIKNNCDETIKYHQIILF